jgi:transposase
MGTEVFRVWLFHVWLRFERLTVPNIVTLLRLPPYAPELNPIENVWEYLRANYLSHIVCDTYEQVVEACCTARNAFIHDIEKVTSVTTRPCAKVTN